METIKPVPKGKFVFKCGKEVTVVYPTYIYELNVTVYMKEKWDRVQYDSGNNPESLEVIGMTYGNTVYTPITKRFLSNLSTIAR